MSISSTGTPRGDDDYVIKIASGFHNNPALGLPSGNGMMLLFDQRTGAPQAVLMDAEEMTAAGYSVETAESASELAARCNLIVTATPTKSPILWSDDVRPGTHIPAMGSDTPKRQELDGALLRQADLTGVAVEDLEIANAVFGAAGGTAPVVGG